MNKQSLVAVLLGLFNVSPAMASWVNDDFHLNDENFLHGYQQLIRRHLKPLGGDAYKYTVLTVCIDGDSKGRLAFERHINGPMPSPELRPTFKLIPKWSENITICKNGDYILMKQSDANEIWGKPIFRGTFYSYDALAPEEGAYETELYHIDLKFDKNGDVSAYRVRGIGIFHPEWIERPQE